MYQDLELLMHRIKNHLVHPVILPNLIDSDLSGMDG